MAAATSEVKRTKRLGNWGSAPVGATKKIYKGTLVALNTTTGHAEPASDSANLVILGIARETVDNTAGTSGGELTISFLKTGEFEFTSSSLAATDMGKPVYVADDQTASKTAGSYGVRIGVITEVVSATKCWVRINDYGIGNFGAAAALDVGTGSGDVAAGDHTHA